MSAGVVVPIRSFVDGKARLADRLSAAQRGRLLQAMATRVVEAAAPLDVAVVSSAPEVVSWARDLSLSVLPDPGSLDGAAGAGSQWFAERGVERVIVAHADLPLATDLASLATLGSEPVAVVVPCHRGDGTPVLSVPAIAAFPFSYGPGSFARHAARARRLGLEVVELWERHDLRRDVDSLDDLDDLDALGALAGLEARGDPDALTEHTL